MKLKVWVVMIVTPVFTTIITKVIAQGVCIELLSPYFWAIVVGSFAGLIFHIIFLSLTDSCLGLFCWYLFIFIAVGALMSSYKNPIYGGLAAASFFASMYVFSNIIELHS